MKHYFISGIGTEVGKTVVCAIATQALEADYWKPIQAGDLHFSDTDKVQQLVSNKNLQFHPNAYGLKTPMSPHAAAEKDGTTINLARINRPKTERNLVIEGAGGLLVPLNHKHCIIDLISPSDKIVLVSRHYLGSINHTLLSIEALKSRGLNSIGIVFSGNENPTTEKIILEKTQVQLLGRIDEEEKFSPEIITSYAEKLKEKLQLW
ncbi:MAG: dethiobiotin synthase [Bacteroidota bacterium]